MGYGNEFGWLSTENVTSRRQATEILSHIPHRLTARASAYSLTLNPQKFDFGLRPALRMTYKNNA